ncbi:alpha-ketoglutarate-dependent dioxygenase AlkB [Zhongshania sp. CAU 1632]|uniref:Alpha-ketoglutarate-dependent dioxygenase AlkB n=1 Tax=Zhongshania aquimaris TaxID=2857107 RepID=A0ABS6VUE6_9GAMM|nr:alpha-ketoglutarate-dependent dioxygenase AlkB [Zhongshania aquimaris]MBW2941943.1 alpha-ketoglutarate-dependent dioxygenase AlkB [Zhongshania aquimaris]
MFTGLQHIPLVGGGLDYYANYLSDPQGLFLELCEQIPWQQPLVKVYGREHLTPRLVYFVGDPGLRYQYSGVSHATSPWPASLKIVRDQLRVDTGFEFNCALLNYYRDGNDSMGYHSDDEVELGESPCIASISLGAERDFCLKPKVGQSKVQKLCLADGSLLLMLPPTQQHWQHALPVRKGVRGGRINLTFRKLLK